MFVFFFRVLFFFARSGFFHPSASQPTSSTFHSPPPPKKPQCGFIRAASPKGFPRHVHDVSLPYPDWLRAVADLVLDAEGRQHTEVLLYR